jgi:bifunctional non-homologous end joining protein LigD
MLSAQLFFTEGSSDKEYRAWISETGDGKYLVQFAYGRRNSALKSGKKTTSPVEYDAAVKIYEALVKSKTSKGYTPEGDGTPYANTDEDGSVSGVVPQLLNVADQKAATDAIYNDNWGMQEKFDGRRMMVRKSGSDVQAINKLGLFVGMSGPVADAAKLLDGDFIIDGECIGDRLHAFDIFERGGEDLRSKQYRARYGALTELVGGSSNIVVVPLWEGTDDKDRMFAELREKNAEGVVFKRLDAHYAPGRPASGGSQLKFKFVDTLSALVTAVNNKRSVGLSLQSDDGLEFVGNVTIPANHDIPDEGDVVEIRYLYANPMLYQPVYLGVRDDILPEECVKSQVKYKASADAGSGYDAENAGKPIVSKGGDLNPGVYSVDESVYRVGDTGALSEFRRGEYRQVRAQGDVQDATYKLKNRGRHTTEAELKALGRESGRCMMCGVALEDAAARARGVGSSCAKKHGMG